MSDQGTAASPEVNRSASQIMFGHLPQQTVDINRGVWKVTRWRDTRVERGIDTAALTTEVLAQAKPWSDVGRDNGLAARLASGSRAIIVRSLARDRGVDVEPFPRIWSCPRCRLVHRQAFGTCDCGAEGSRNQVHFVCYCATCGALEEPPIQPCPTHRKTRITFPGTMSATQIIQDCPTCRTELRKGFAGKRCGSCGQVMSAQVHRAASVFSPRTAVIVNPPDKVALERIDNAGGEQRALDWVVSGMRTRWMDAMPPTAASLRATLVSQGLGQELVDGVVQQALAKGQLSADSSAALPPSVTIKAQQEAKHIAVAFSEGRSTINDLLAHGPEGLRDVYRDRYPAAIAAAHLHSIDFIDRFPVLVGNFGYVRGPQSTPQQSVLVPFLDERGDFVVYGEVNETEALFIRLDPEKVIAWLEAEGHSVPPGDTPWTRVLLARGADVSGTVGDLITTLVHSYAHRFIRTAAVFSGVERTSLSEFLVPHHLGFFIYAASRGDFVLGGLQAVFEGELHLLLESFIEAERRCALDPGCSHNGAACMACLHLGEPSCRLFNTKLDRRVLYGEHGYLE